MSSKSKPGSSRVSREDAGRAIDALLGFLRARAKQQKAQLFEHDDFIYLHISVRRLRSTSRLKPYLIPLPHTLHPLDPSRTSLCLIADDSLADAARSTAADENLPFDSVIPLSQLRTDYVPFEARRRLCDSYDIFFAERRIVPILPRLIGKCFFKRKKVPLPINISRPGWPEAIREACRSTLLHLGSGTCSGLKVGRVSMDREQIIDNLMATIVAAVEHIPKNWANIRCMHIMSVQSVALPIYQAVPEIGMRIDVGPREKTEPLDGVVDQETCVKREVEEKNKKKSGLSKKRKMRIHDVDFIGADLHDRSEEVDEDGEEEQRNDELGLKKKVKKNKKDEQGRLSNCKKGKSAGNKEDECEEKENDGDFIELVTERKKMKRAKKIVYTGVEDYAIKVGSADDHGYGKKKKMKSSVMKGKCASDVTDDDNDVFIELDTEGKKAKRAKKIVNTASEEYVVKDGFADDHGDGKELQLKKKEKNNAKKSKGKKMKKDIINGNNEDHEHVVAYEEANLVNVDCDTHVDDHFRDDVSRVKKRTNLDRKSTRDKKHVKAKN